jgi:hypothetical protein
VTIERYPEDKPDFVYFNRATGMVEVLTDDIGGARPEEYGFKISGSRGAVVRILVSVGGRATACQVGGTSLGLSQCP